MGRTRKSRCALQPSAMVQEADLATPGLKLPGSAVGNGHTPRPGASTAVDASAEMGARGVNSSPSLPLIDMHYGAHGWSVGRLEVRALGVCNWNQCDLCVFRVRDTQ